MLLKKVYFTYFIPLRITWWIQWHWVYCYFVKFAYQKMNFLLCMGWISNGLNVFKFKLMHLFICAFFGMIFSFLFFAFLYCIRWKRETKIRYLKRFCWKWIKNFVSGLLFLLIYAGHMFLYKCRRFYIPPTYLEFFALKKQMGLSPLHHV